MGWLLVELEEDLAAHLTTPTGVFASIKVVSGVVRVVDLSAISRETLGLMLLPEEQTWEYTQRKGGTSYNAIRNHHKRKRQPPLPLEP
jgi:hypothetical protein